ncbi:OPT oligopeptide transporter protein-domain-containing protein [Kockiozyma suomiensis]|uniref:OPT oligopeptide transporter protein-domain-containing protein n=1 Tax=Kockiozyma suomiensis TaxID=1337062 RepID=UPI003343F558
MMNQADIDYAADTKQIEIGSESDEKTNPSSEVSETRLFQERLTVSSKDMELVKDYIDDLSLGEAISILATAAEYHQDDLNFASAIMDKIKLLLAGADAYGTDAETHEFDAKVEAALIKYFSPYPEVRSISLPEDAEVPIETYRSYLITIVWVIVGAGVNQFFSTRFPQITLTTDIMQLLIYLSGKAFDYLPAIGIRLFGKHHSLNPGPWSFQEQMFCTIAVNSGISIPYVTQANIIVQKLDIFYGSSWVTIGYQFLLVLSSQFMGFGFAGLMRRIAVYPVKALWPIVLPSLAMNRMLLSPKKKENINGWTISGYTFFFIVFAASFAWAWVPVYLFPALSQFDWMSWIAPNNFNLAAVTGIAMGMGINPVPSFDWSVIGYSSPLVIPFFSYINTFIGTALGTLIILATYYTNYRWTAYIPINTNTLVTNTMDSFDVSMVIGEDGKFDESLYQEYSPAFYSAGSLMYYGSLFALHPALLVWTGLNYGPFLKDTLFDFMKSLRDRSRSIYARFTDPFSQYMRRHKEVPDWWFLIVLTISFIFAVVCLTVYPTQTSVGGLILVIFINFVFLTPITLLNATTGMSLNLNLITELISGYMYPGNGNALMTLKAFGVMIDKQATTYISDQKAAHYSRIPPRAVFRGQIFATLISVIVSLGVLNWQMGHVSNFCSSEQVESFSCPNAWSFFSASIMFGILGPKKMFDGMYPILPWCFLIGALAVVPFIFAKKYCTRVFSSVHPILVLSGMTLFAPYNISYYIPGFYMSFAFMFFIRRRYLAWWEKYNYLLSSGLGAGLAFSVIIIFFAVQYHPKYVVWWGLNVLYSGVEGGEGQVSLLQVPEAGYFGPDPGSYP